MLKTVGFFELPGTVGIGKQTSIRCSRRREIRHFWRAKRAEWRTAPRRGLPVLSVSGKQLLRGGGRRLESRLGLRIPHRAVAAEADQSNGGCHRRDEEGDLRRN